MNLEKILNSLSTIVCNFKVKTKMQPHTKTRNVLTAELRTKVMYTSGAYYIKMTFQCSTIGTNVAFQEVLPWGINYCSLQGLPERPIIPSGRSIVWELISLPRMSLSNSSPRASSIPKLYHDLWQIHRVSVGFQQNLLLNSLKEVIQAPAR